MKRYLSVCAIFKDEAEYLEEWLRFYDLLGVDHFYLYNHASTDDYATVLAPWIAAGRVTLRHATMNAPQLPAYSDCLFNDGKENTWIAFLDIDEFLFSPVQSDLRCFLQPFEGEAGVVANWVMFGASGHQHKPAGLMTLNYTQRCDLNLCTFEPALLKQPNLDPKDPRSYHPVCSHVKSIVNTREAIGVWSPHQFAYRDGRLAVTAERRPVSAAVSDEVAIDSLRVNHYFSRSWDEFHRKLQRGRADVGGKYDAAAMIERNRLFDEVHDTTIFPFAQKVQAAITSAKPLEKGGD
jgi:hypothetical protein